MKKNSCIVKSTAHSTIDTLYELWYEDRKKIFPLRFVKEHLTEESLAWWYQDCGHLKKKENGTLEKLIISAEQWTDEERGLLQHVLNLKFGLLFAVDGQKRLLLYDQLQINYFLTLVQPWMQLCMVRKMKTITARKPIAERTTISLPDSISLSKPTRQINDAIEHWHHLICCTPDQFKHWNYQRSEMNSMLSYQIKLTPKNQSRLMNIQAQSGLHLNEIIQDAFYQQKLHEPPSLNNLNQLSTTQQAITIASILGDGSLRKRQSRTYSSSYYENSCEEQRPYRQWKVNKLKPYLYFPGKLPYITSRKSSLWAKLEEQFYTSERIKQIPLHLIKNINDPHFLMTLYLDDGSLMISHRVNHRNKKIYILPHIALYLQNFKKEELGQFTYWLNDTYGLELTLAGRPDGQGFYIRTTSVKATFDFLKQIEMVSRTYPHGDYKANWSYRWYLEKEKWKRKYPTYEILVSSRERMRPYNKKEIEIIISMKKENRTDQAIADALGRTYWSIVYKIQELRKENKL